MISLELPFTAIYFYFINGMYIEPKVEMFSCTEKKPLICTDVSQGNCSPCTSNTLGY